MTEVELGLNHARLFAGVQRFSLCEMLVVANLNQTQKIIDEMKAAQTAKEAVKGGAKSEEK